jgi:hypothetical protein
MKNIKKSQEIVEEIIEQKLKKVEKDFEKVFMEITNISKSFKEKIKTELTDEEIEKLKEIEQAEEQQTNRETVGLSDFKELVKKIGESDTQSKILDLLMEGLKRYTTRAYFFIKKGDKIVCFKSLGTKAKKTKNILMPDSLDTSLKFVFEKGEIYYGNTDTFSEEYILLKKLEPPETNTIFVLPLKVKGKPMAVVYIDNKGEEISNKDLLEILVEVVSMSLDLLPIKKWITASFEQKKGKKTEKIIGEDSTKEEIEEVAPLSEEEMKEHKNAQRLSRVIISDIISYNRDKIDEGIQRGNIYKYIKTEIDQASAHFYNKVDEKIWKRENYFEQDLIEKVAKGDKKLLDGYNFKS